MGATHRCTFSGSQFRRSTGVRSTCAGVLKRQVLVHALLFFLQPAAAVLCGPHRGQRRPDTPRATPLLRSKGSGATPFRVRVRKEWTVARPTPDAASLAIRVLADVTTYRSDSEADGVGATEKPTGNHETAGDALRKAGFRTSRLGRKFVSQGLLGTCRAVGQYRRRLFLMVRIAGTLPWVMLIMPTYGLGWTMPTSSRSQNVDADNIAT